MQCHVLYSAYTLSHIWQNGEIPPLPSPPLPGPGLAPIPKHHDGCFVLPTVRLYSLSPRLFAMWLLIRKDTWEPLGETTPLFLQRRLKPIRPALCPCSEWPAGSFSVLRHCPSLSLTPSTLLHYPPTPLTPSNEEPNRAQGISRQLGPRV